MSYPESLRDRTPKDEAYPIRRAALDAELTAAAVATLDTVYFLRAGIEEWRGSGAGEVMRIDFTARRADDSERTEIRVHAVPAAMRHVIGTALTTVLDEVARWVRRTETSENVWRSTDHAFVLRWDGNSLQRDER